MRIGVNGGSLNQELVMAKMQENTDRNLGKDSDDIINECMVLSALQSTELAIETGLRKDQIIISCKVSRPRHLIDVYRALAKQTDQPLHLGLTEAGMGTKGLVWSASAMGVLLNEGIGDTIRVSLTPRPGGDRREEVYAACELLQALGLRAFAPSVTACPGCGRTTSTTFQELAEAVQGYIREQMPEWKKQYDGVETLTLAVMGCVVNGPGESKAANIGISLPGTGEAPNCPVFIDGVHATTLKGTYDELALAFQKLLDDYVETQIREEVEVTRDVVTIRPATPADRAFVLDLADRLVVVRRAAHGASKPELVEGDRRALEAWFDDRRQPDEAMFIAELDGAPAGLRLPGHARRLLQRTPARASVGAGGRRSRPKAKVSALPCSIACDRLGAGAAVGSTDAERARHQRAARERSTSARALAANTSATSAAQL